MTNQDLDLHGLGELSALLAREFPRLAYHQAATLAIELAELSHLHHKTCEALCEADRPIDRVTQEQTEAKITNLLEEFGVKVGTIFQGDPRGYTVRLLLPSGVYNTWGGKESGWGVVTLSPQ